MLIDCHVHSTGREKADDVMKSMDEGGVDRAVIFAPYPSASKEVSLKPTLLGEFSYPGVTSRAQRESTKFISRLQAEAPDRIIGFAWIEPRLQGAPQNVEEAVTKFECKGVKMIPDHWYPYDPRIFMVYEKIQELGIPVLFHSGILFGFKDSSRFCRPCNYEALINFPNVKFALAHISWPWTDECIALFGRFRANLRERVQATIDMEKMQMYIDTTPGTPLVYRREALQKAVVYGAEDFMIFGSDCGATNFQHSKQVAEMDRTIIRRELGFPEEVVEKIQGKNIEKYLKK